MKTSREILILTTLVFGVLKQNIFENGHHHEQHSNLTQISNTTNPFMR